jgi:hypothetical protein
MGPINGRLVIWHWLDLGWKDEAGCIFLGSEFAFFASSPCADKSQVASIQTVCDVSEHGTMDLIALCLEANRDHVQQLVLPCRKYYS